MYEVVQSDDGKALAISFNGSLIAVVNDGVINEAETLVAQANAGREIESLVPQGAALQQHFLKMLSEERKRHVDPVELLDWTYLFLFVKNTSPEQFDDVLQIIAQRLR